MRGPKRIDDILDILKVIWKKYPDMRFFQLIESIESKTEKFKDLFYMEDDEIKKLLLEIMMKGF